MRARNIKPGILRNEFFGTADPLLTLLFQGLWMLADREGRLEDRPMRIKADVFPYRDFDINGGLTVIQREGFIRRYEVCGKRYIQITNFREHQRPHSTEARSVIPPEPAAEANNSEPTVSPPLDHALNTGFTDSLIHSPDGERGASPPLPPPPPPAKQKKRKSKVAPNRGARLPQDWTLPQDWGEWAEKQGLSMAEILRERDKFRNYWKAKPGADGTKLDWEGTWQNWIYRHLERKSA